MALSRFRQATTLGGFTVLRIVVLLLALALANGLASAQDFYKGETTRTLVGFPSGGGYDAYAHYIHKPFPGNPAQAAVGGTVTSVPKVLDRKLLLSNVLKRGYKSVKDEPVDTQAAIPGGFPPGGGYSIHVRKPANPGVVFQSMPGVDNAITANGIFKINRAKHRYTGIPPSDSMADRTGASMLNVLDGKLLLSNVLKRGYKGVKDEPVDIWALIARTLAAPGLNTMLLNGGTGILPTHGTYEIVSSMPGKRMDGFGELFHVLGHKDSSSVAMQTRAIASAPKDLAEILQKAYNSAVNDPAFRQLPLRSGMYSHYGLKVRHPAGKERIAHRRGATGLL